ncbi:MAG: hemerythrin domain-containing protein [Vitreoscilla sp.]
MATATRKTTAAKATRKTPAKASRGSTTSSGQDAIALLRADHKRVSDLYEQYESTRSAAKKKTIVASICLELSVHAQVEEEIFYPAVKAALKDKELVPEAQVEHASLKELIAQVKDKEPDGEMFDAKIKVMSEYTKHHVKEEQNEMFPKAKNTRLDMKELGERIAARKEELMANPALLEAAPATSLQPMESVPAE